MGKRDLILRVAGELFAAEGYDGTTVDEIASKASVNKAMIYYYFKNKEDLYQTVLRSSIEKVLNKLRENIKDFAKPEESIEIYLRSFYEQAKQDKPFLRILLMEIASGGKHMLDDTVGVFVNILQILQNILESGVKTGVFRNVNPKITHFTIVGALSFYLCSSEIRKRFKDKIGKVPTLADDSEEEIKEITKIVLRGLKA